MDLTADLQTLVLSSSTTITDAQRTAFEPAALALNDAPAEDLQRAVVAAGPAAIAALLSLPDRDQRGQPLTRIRDDVLLTAVEAVLGPSSGFRSLGLLPRRLTTAWAGPRISDRVFTVVTPELTSVDLDRGAAGFACGGGSVRIHFGPRGFVATNPRKQ